MRDGCVFLQVPGRQREDQFTTCPGSRLFPDEPPEDSFRDLAESNLPR